MEKEESKAIMAKVRADEQREQTFFFDLTIEEDLCEESFANIADTESAIIPV